MKGLFDLKFIKEIFKKFGITKETAKRAGRTFIQTACGYIAVNIAVVDFSGGKDVVKSALCGLMASAVAAGIAAVMNRERSKTESESVEE